MSFAKFMAGPIGHGARILVGVVLVVIGLASGAWWLAIIGLAPLAMGVLNICILAPILKAPFSGKATLQQR